MARVDPSDAWRYSIENVRAIEVAWKYEMSDEPKDEQSPGYLHATRLSLAGSRERRSKQQIYTEGAGGNQLLQYRAIACSA